jgi:ribosome-binding factor A
MHQESNRPRRVAHLLQREVANLIQREVNDPRVQHVTITSVEVSRDLSRAKVYFTCLDTDSDAKAAEKALNHAAYRTCVLSMMNRLSVVRTSVS